jgi:hypothetical protein
MSINTSGKNVRISAPAILSNTNGALANRFLAIKFIIVIPHLSARVVETHLAGRDLNNNISIVCNTLVCLVSEHWHKVVWEYLVTNTWGTKAVELNWVAEFKRSLDVKHSECSEGTAKRVASYQNSWERMKSDETGKSWSDLWRNSAISSVETRVDLSVGNIFILNSVVYEVGHPVEKVGSICTTESNDDLIINRIISNITKRVQKFIFNLENIASAWEAAAWLTTGPVIYGVFTAVSCTRVIKSFVSKVLIINGVD